MSINTSKAFDAPRGIQTPSISPVVDSATALQITDSDGTNSIIIVDSTNKRLGINSQPTAQLHLSAGTTSTGTAPLKLTSGNNLATPEDGAVEYNGTHFYATVGSTRYQLDQQSGGSGVSFETSTGNILMNGTVSVGTLSTAPRADHVHPSDTSRAAVNATTYIGTTAVALNRASSALALTGITSIDGSAETVVDKGSVANATKDFVVSQVLRWKNYGNGHVIFDASAGTSPAGGAVNNTLPAVVWQAGYASFMGWNGTNTYGVCVDLAQRIRTSAPASPRAGDIWFE